LPPADASGAVGFGGVAAGGFDVTTGAGAGADEEVTGTGAGAATAADCGAGADGLPAGGADAVTDAGVAGFGGGGNCGLADVGGVDGNLLALKAGLTCPGRIACCCAPLTLAAPGGIVLP